MAVDLGRILLILPEAFRTKGGIQAYDRLLIRAFLDLSATRRGACEILLLNDGAADVEQGARERPGRLGVFGGSRVRFIAASLWSVLRQRPDLIVLGHVNFAPLALGLRALRPSASQWFVAYGIEAWKRLGLLHRWGLRQADSIVAISDFTRRELARHNGLSRERIPLLPCAVGPEWASREPADADAARLDRPTLLTVSRLASGDTYKGIDQVLRALPDVARAFPVVRYVIVGDGDDRPRLEAIARELGVSDRVEFRGNVSQAELTRAYQESSLFIMPSSGEGFGIVFIEAALLAKPSIAARDGGAPEVVEDGQTGRLVDPRDVSEISRAVVDLLSEPSRLREMGARARAQALQRFSYEGFRRTLAALLAATGTPRPTQRGERNPASIR